MQRAIYRLAGLGLAGAAVIAAAPAAATPVLHSRQPSAGELLVAGARTYDARRCPDAAPILANAVARPDFKDLPTQAQSLGYEIATRCAIAGEAWNDALTYARTGTGFTEASDWLWLTRFALEASLGKLEDSIDTAERIAADRPKQLSVVPLTQMRQVDAALRARPDPASLRRRFLAALAAADYTPPDPLDVSDGLWIEQARLAADAGDTETAAKALGRMQAAMLLARASLDIRFADLVAARPALFDFRALGEKLTARDRALLAAHPDRLAIARQLAEDLQTLGRHAEALTVLDAAVAKLSAAKPGAPAPFVDAADEANWLWNDRAELLLALGRVDEAVQGMVSAAALPERGGPNISQTLNLASMLVDADRPEQALVVLQRLDSTGADRITPYGRLYAAGERACAYQQLGRAAERDTELAKLKAEPSANWPALTRALICAGDLDGAASAYLSRLQDPGARMGALTALSRFTPAPSPTPFQRELAARRETVRSRPEVRAAAARVGRLADFPLSGRFTDDF